MNGRSSTETPFGNDYELDAAVPRLYVGILFISKIQDLSPIYAFHRTTKISENVARVRFAGDRLLKDGLTDIQRMTVLVAGCKETSRENSLPGGNSGIWIGLELS